MNIRYHNRLGRGYEGEFSPIAGNDLQCGGKDGSGLLVAVFTLRNRLEGQEGGYHCDQENINVATQKLVLMDDWGMSHGNPSKRR